MGKASIIMPLPRAAFPEITSKGCRTFFPLENKKDEEIKRLRKIIRRLRKQNKG
jgi:hypothetical protein